MPAMNYPPSTAPVGPHPAPEPRPTAPPPPGWGADESASRDADRRHIDFDAAHDTDSERPREPITFRLGGQDFAAYGEVGGTVLARMLHELATTDMVDVYGLLADLMPPDEFERLVERVEDPQHPIDLPRVMDVAVKILEEHAAGLPLAEQPPSPFGPPTGGRRLRRSVARSTRAGTYPR